MSEVGLENNGKKWKKRRWNEKRIMPWGRMINGGSWWKSSGCIISRTVSEVWNFFSLHEDASNLFFRISKFSALQNHRWREAIYHWEPYSFDCRPEVNNTKLNSVPPKSLQTSELWSVSVGTPCQESLLMKLNCMWRQPQPEAVRRNARQDQNTLTKNKYSVTICHRLVWGLF